MTRLQRLLVDTPHGLRALKPGDSVPLSEQEAHHARVLGLGAGAEVEIFDGGGTAALATLMSSPQGLSAVVLSPRAAAAPSPGITLAVAWPKGKRAAWLVEKCSELGVTHIVPVRFARGVVHKAEGSESLARLRRIAAAAAKQCGRNDLPEISAELTFEQLLAVHAPRHVVLLLDPRAELRMTDALAGQRDILRQKPLLLIVGPEGGLEREEFTAALAHGAAAVRLARHVLRIETAALAACAIAESCLGM